MSFSDSRLFKSYYLELWGELMHRIVSCLAWNKATRKRLSRLSVHHVRVEQLSLNRFVSRVSDKH